MTDPNVQPASHDELIKAAKKAVRQQLTQAPYLVTPEGARRIVEEEAHRLVPFSNGIVRALRRGTTSEFYPVADTEDPLAPFVYELANAVPDEDRLEAIQQRREEVARLTEEKRADPRYHVL